MSSPSEVSPTWQVVGQADAANGAHPVDTQDGPSGSRELNGNGLFDEFLKGQSELLELMACGVTLPETLMRIASVVERILAPGHCSIQLISPDTKEVGQCAAPSLPDALSSVIGDFFAGCDASPCGAAVSNCEPIAITNLECDPRWAAFRELALPLGLRACLLQPICGQDHEILGVLGILYREPREFTANDRGMAEAMARLVAFATKQDNREAAPRVESEPLVSPAATIPGVVYQRLVTPEGDIRYTYISEGTQDLFGVPPEEILANPQALFDCHGPEYRATFRERLLEASRKLDTWDVEAQIITRDGEEKWTHAIARPHRQSDGSVLWTGVILDSTWIKSTELELREAKLAAEAANQAKTNFLAQMSHELRTPLNAIIGFSDLLKNQSFGVLGHPNYIEYAGDIHTSGAHLLEIINDILEFTQLEEGQQKLSESRVILEDVIDTALGKTTIVADAAQVTLSKNINEQLPLVLVDEMKIKKILVILLSNAVKFTPQNGNVTITANLDEIGNLSISVIDTGIGMAAADIQKIFEPFAQIDGELNRKYEGTGLGIPLAVSLARLHGAHIAIESDIGMGTKATLVLPADRVIPEVSSATSAGM